MLLLVQSSYDARRSARLARTRPVYTNGMDKVRFGRALGFGARQAGKALWRAAEAATAPDPRVGTASAATPVPSTAARQAGTRVRENISQARSTSVTVKREGKRFGQAMWGPVARASGVLWLELTGVFFGIFAVTAGTELYRHHADFAATGAPRQHEWFAAAMFALFGWFTVSSFVRARKRSRRPLQ